jgi:hypothetical protein
VPTAADSGQVNVTRLPDRPRCLGQSTLSSSTQVINGPLKFEGLAKYVLQEVGHASGPPEETDFGNRFHGCPF